MRDLHKGAWPAVGGPGEEHCLVEEGLSCGVDTLRYVLVVNGAWYELIVDGETRLPPGQFRLRNLGLLRER